MTMVVGILLWLAAAYRIHSWRREASLVNGVYAGAAGSIAAAFTVKILASQIDALCGPFISDLLEHLFVVLGGYSAQIFLLTLRDGRPSRPSLVSRTVLSAAVMLMMVGAFLVAPVHQARGGDLDEVFGRLGTVAVYRLIFDCQLTYVLVDVIRLCLRNALVRGDVSRSISLILTGSGAGIAVLYPLSRLIDITVQVIGRPPSLTIHTVGSSAASLGLLAMAAGMLIPHVLTTRRSWLNARCGARRLDVLWSDLTSAFPEVRLPVGRGLTPGKAELRYVRRLAEVSEGLALAHVRGAAGPPAAPDLREQARILLHSRPSWAEQGGLRACELLSGPSDASVDDQQLLALADAYAAIVEIPTRQESYA